MNTEALQTSTTNFIGRQADKNRTITKFDLFPPHLTHIRVIDTHLSIIDNRNPNVATCQYHYEFRTYRLTCYRLP